MAPSLLLPALSRSSSSLGHSRLSSSSRSTGTSGRRPAPAHYISGQCVVNNSDDNPVLHGDPSPGTTEDFNRSPPCLAPAGETPGPTPAATAPGRGSGTSGHCPAPAPAPPGQCINRTLGNNRQLHGVFSPGASKDVNRSRQDQQFLPPSQQGTRIPITIEVNGVPTRINHSEPVLVPDSPDVNMDVFFGNEAEVAADIGPQTFDEDEGIDLAEKFGIPVPAPPPDCRCHAEPMGSCPDFIKIIVDLVETVNRSGLPNQDGARIEVPGRSINPDNWGRWLGNYYDREPLLAGLLYGWDLSFTAPPDPRDSVRNLPSAEMFPDAIQQYITTELQYGSMVGPLPDKLPFRTFASPMGSVPKTVVEGVVVKRRCITDMSQRGAGVNQFIPHDQHRGRAWKISLPGASNIAAAIARARRMYPGQRIKLAKLDFSRYYRWFCVDPGQIRFQAVCWKGKRYLDRSWGFGNRGAVAGAQRYSQAAAWIFCTQLAPGPGLVNIGVDCHCSTSCECGSNICLAYIDDLIMVLPESVADYLFAKFVNLVGDLSLQLSATAGHIVEPRFVITVLGCEYDTINNIIRLPQDKLDAFSNILALFLHKQAASRRELASLAGKLLFASQVIQPGRLFLARVLAVKNIAPEDESPVNLTDDFREDIRWWVSHIEGWNGRSFLVHTQTAHLALDASKQGWYGGYPGLGAYNLVNNQFFSCGVPVEFQDWDISELELLAHIIACKVWDHDWDTAAVSIATDNEVCRWLLSNGRCRHPARLAMARLLVSRQWKGNYRINSVRVSTEENVLADALSREAMPGMWQRFLEVCSGNGVVPTRVRVEDVFFKDIINN